MFYFYFSDEISNLLFSTGNLFKQNFFSCSTVTGTYPEQAVKGGTRQLRLRLQTQN